MNREAGRKIVCIVRNAVIGTVESMVVKLVEKACKPLSKYCSLGPLRAVIPSYLWFNPAGIKYHVSLQQPDGIVSLKEKNSF